MKKAVISTELRLSFYKNQLPKVIYQPFTKTTVLKKIIAKIG
jgi:hypothetical protein